MVGCEATQRISGLTTNSHQHCTWRSWISVTKYDPQRHSRSRKTKKRIASYTQAQRDHTPFKRTAVFEKEVRNLENHRRNNNAKENKDTLKIINSSIIIVAANRRVYANFLRVFGARVCFSLTSLSHFLARTHNDIAANAPPPPPHPTSTPFSPNPPQ